MPGSHKEDSRRCRFSRDQVVSFHLYWDSVEEQNRCEYTKRRCIRLAYMVQSWECTNRCLRLKRQSIQYLHGPQDWMSRQSQPGTEGLEAFWSSVCLRNPFRVCLHTSNSVINKTPHRNAQTCLSVDSGCRQADNQHGPLYHHTPSAMEETAIGSP